MYDGYKELIVWQESIKIVVEIYKLTKVFPSIEKFGLVSQMQKAAVSIPSNIAEGWSRNYDKVFIQFLNTSQGSAAELETQLIISVKLGYLTTETVDEVLKLLVSIKKMIRSLILKVQARINNNKPISE